MNIYLFNLFFLTFSLTSCINSNEKNCLEKNRSQNEKNFITNKCKIIYSFNYENNTISFNTKINDSIIGNFIFDTGLTSSYSLFSKCFADKNGFSELRSKNKKIYGVGIIHNIPVIDTVIQTEVFDSKKLLQFGIMDLGLADELYDGIFNVHIFKEKIIELDFSEKTLKFHDNFLNNGFTKIIVLKRGNVRLLELTINLSKTEKIKGLFMLDTGYSGCIYLYADDSLFENLILKKNSKKILGIKNFNTDISTYSLNIPSVNLDSLNIENPIINFGKVNLPTEAKGTVLGLVGNKFLDRFNIVIDFKNNILYLKQINSNYEGAKSSFGVTFSKTQNFAIIRSIIENSLAHQKGLLPNDLVTEIDGKNVKRLTEAQIDSILYDLEKKNQPFKLNLIRKKSHMSILINKWIK